MRNLNLNIIAYVILAVGLSAGVYAMTERAEDHIVDNINQAVTELCLANRPTIMKENKLRDIQIEVNQDAIKLNLKRGDKQRAELSRRQVIALRNAKRHVPTVAECNQNLLE